MVEAEQRLLELGLRILGGAHAFRVHCKTDAERYAEACEEGMGVCRAAVALRFWNITDELKHMQQIALKLSMEEVNRA